MNDRVLYLAAGLVAGLALYEYFKPRYYPPMIEVEDVVELPFSDTRLSEILDAINASAARFDS